MGKIKIVILMFLIVFFTENIYSKDSVDFGFTLDDFKFGKTSLKEIVDTLVKRGIEYDLTQRGKDYFVYSTEDKIYAPYTYQLSFKDYLEGNHAYFKLYFAPQQQYLWRIEAIVDISVDELVDYFKRRYGKKFFYVNNQYHWQERVNNIKVWDTVAIYDTGLKGYNIRFVWQDRYWYLTAFGEGDSLPKSSKGN